MIWGISDKISVILIKVGSLLFLEKWQWKALFHFGDVCVLVRGEADLSCSPCFGLETPIVIGMHSEMKTFWLKAISFTTVSFINSGFDKLAVPSGAQRSVSSWGTYPGEVACFVGKCYQDENSGKCKRKPKAHKRKPFSVSKETLPCAPPAFFPDWLLAL